MSVLVHSGIGGPEACRGIAGPDAIAVTLRSDAVAEPGDVATPRTGSSELPGVSCPAQVNGCRDAA
jgi:hypothetical protein